MATTREQNAEMLNLIKILNQATIQYDKGYSMISDKEWDDLYFKLSKLEKDTGTILPNSPTKNIIFETVSQLEKVEHDHPMLSLEKTKDIEAIKNFISDKNWIAMCKMDGLTCSLHYKNGVLVGAETRGDGIIGENILHNAKVIKNIPNNISYQDELIIDGEIICTYENFKQFEEKYKNPRNFASGSIRLLDSKECYCRNLNFIAWDMVKGRSKFTSLSSKLTTLIDYGFNVVPYIALLPTDIDKIEIVINNLKKSAESKSYPIDGIVFKYNNTKEYENAGRTDHHFKGGLAYKFYDETYSTKLKYIDWTMGRTGILTPVAVFDPVNIDGTEVSRASLHNVSIMKETLGEYAYLNESLQITKANQIIPQIYSAGPKYTENEAASAGVVRINDKIDKCPICGGTIIYKNENDVIRAYCDNPSCNGKLINKIDHFCGKKGLDIKGLSKMTLEKLINWEWINSLQDIFKLKNYREEWINKAGFGKASVDKIITAIDKSSECSMSKYICALGIPLIGKVASEALERTFNTYNNFREAVKNKNDKLYQISGIGEVLINNLLNYDYTEADIIFDNFIKEKNIVDNDTLKQNTFLNNKIFVITGKIKSFKNRDELKKFIEDNGGKVTSSVTSKTSYLINNDTAATTTKNLNAIKLKIPIITEEEFLIMVKNFKKNIHDEKNNEEK